MKHTMQNASPGPAARKLVCHACCCISSRLQAAYNWALAAYFHHGKDHAETKAALAATKAADSKGLVPKLLAGLAYPPVSMAPASVPGRNMEAAVSQVPRQGPCCGCLQTMTAQGAVSCCAYASSHALCQVCNCPSASGVPARRLCLLMLCNACRCTTAHISSIGDGKTSVLGWGSTLADAYPPLTAQGEVVMHLH
jgi:hypothetical protein